MSTTFRPSDPSSRNDVPSRLELQILRVQRTMFIVNCMWMVVFGFVLWWIATSPHSPAITSAPELLQESVPEVVHDGGIGVWGMQFGSTGVNKHRQGRLTPAGLPVIESDDSGKLFVIPPWSAPPLKPAPTTASPKFKYRYVTETQVNCKTCPGGVCPVH